MCSIAASREGTTAAEISSARYSVRPVLVGGRHHALLGGEGLVAVDGDARPPGGARTIRGTNSSATSWCTSSDSAALQTEVRWVLALSTMRSAMSRSASAST